MNISDFKDNYCIQINNSEDKKILFDYLISKNMNWITNYCIVKKCNESPFPYYVYFGYAEDILYPLITNVKPTDNFRITVNFSDVIFI